MLSKRARSSPQRGHCSTVSALDCVRPESNKKDRKTNAAFAMVFISLLALILMGFLMISLIVSADTQTPATLEGTVTDETGARITVAAAVLENLDYTYIRKTGEQGQYRFLKVAPGNYTLTIHAEGFARSSSQVELVAGRTSVLNVVLKVFISDQTKVRGKASDTSTEPARKHPSRSIWARGSINNKF